MAPTHQAHVTTVYMPWFLLMILGVVLLYGFFYCLSNRAPHALDVDHSSLASCATPYFSLPPPPFPCNLSLYTHASLCPHFQWDLIIGDIFDKKE